MPGTDKHYLVINSPTLDEPGEFYLITERPGSLMTGGGQVVHVVDELKHLGGVGEAAWIQGMRGDAIVVEFPASNQYLLVRRDKAELLDYESAARMQYAANKNYRDVMRELSRGDTPDQLAEVTAGGLGQYL